MNYDVESYERAVNKQWETLDKSKTLDEIETVLKTWPDLKNFKIKEDTDEQHCTDNEKQSECSKAVGGLPQE
jgi:hypothetical protein